MPDASPSERQDDSNRIVMRTAWLAIGIGLAIVVPMEFQRIRVAARSEAGWADWLNVIDPDTTVPLVAFLLLPVFWMVRSRPTQRPGSPGSFFQRWFGESTKPAPGTTRIDILRAVVLASVPFLISLAVSARIGATPVQVQSQGPPEAIAFKNLPPALHDEYSYLFQARTFLSGRVAWPSPQPHPELFHQMHVLNDDGVYAGRYFPGTAIWMSPFVAIEKPHWSHWLASALSAAFVFFIGRELAGNGVGLLAGLFAAVSPGIQTFAQLLLAHQPTLLGLTFFAWMFLRMMRTGSRSSAFFAGSGLIFATLCRPMTAAGVGLPFGIWFLWWWVLGSKKSGDQDSFAKRTLVVLSLGFPILLGIGGMMIYNHRLTGDPLVTPYQLYTDTYTPRHVYGFDNVNRAAENTSDKVIEKYDRWAENLTPSLAVENVKKRIIATGRWSLAMVPLAMALGVFPFLAGKISAPYLADRRWWLILATIFSLHLAHIPYWYAGIRDWHYVFEGAPFLLLIAAGVSIFFLSEWRKRGQVGLMIWWAGFLLVSLWTAYGPLPEGSGPSRVAAVINQDIWARRNYAQFDRMLDAAITDRPALVLIAGDPADRHMDPVTNLRPDREQEILRGRYLPDRVPIEDVLESFPDKSVYVVVLNPKLDEEIKTGEHGSANWEYIIEGPFAGGNAVLYRIRRGSN